MADGADMCANVGSEFSRSTGDEPGTDGGVTSGVNTREATWITYSFDVRLEGRGACRLSDKMFHNRQNTVNMAGLVQPPLKPPSDPKCAALYQIIYDIIWRIRPPTPPGGRPQGEKGLAWRWEEYAENKGGWTPGRRTNGHTGEYLEQQERLKNKLSEWRNRKVPCNDDDLPPGAEEYANQVPELGPGKPIAPEPTTSQFKKYAKDAAIAGAGVATGFIVFEVVTRIIRLLPPLWPLQLSPI